MGYNKINYLVCTNPHADHIGGMIKIIRDLDIEKIYMPKVLHTTNVYRNLLLTIRQKKLKVHTAKSGITILKNDHLDITIIAPVNSFYENLNNYSAVIKITYGTNSFLFMGDAQTLSENEITADIKADVLKVGHHGSDTATSESFLQRVSPKYAIISVGKDNEYGHPSSTTLNKLKNIGATVWRTDQDGTITVKSDGINITVYKNLSL